MILNTSGGGASLNFKVVGGTTQPTNPSENTIWVNTSTAIPSWAFSSNNPDSPATGMVWFVIGDASTTPLNALKTNGIEMYPMFVRQYNGSSWVDKVAKCYQNGKWITIYVPKLYIYKSGVGAVQLLDVYFADGMSVRVSTDEIEIKYTGAAIGLNVTTQEAIGLSNYSKLCATAYCNRTVDSEPVLAFFSKRSTNYNNTSNIAGVAFKNDGVKRTYSVAIPSGTSSAYIGLFRSFQGKVYDIWLE